MTSYLRFESEEQAKTVLSDYFDEVWNTASLTHALDPVGVIYNDDAVLDGEGNVIKNATAKSGWHVNFIGELAPYISAYEAFPNSPRRVFAE